MINHNYTLLQLEPADYLTLIRPKSPGPEGLARKGSWSNGSLSSLSHLPSCSLLTKLKNK